MIWPNVPPIAHGNNYSQDFKPLTDKEIDQFISELDSNRDGFVSFNEVAEKLDAVLKQLIHVPQEHHLHYSNHQQHSKDEDENSSIERGERGRSPTHEHEGVERFVRDLFPLQSSPIPNGELRDLIKSWNVPSRHQGGIEGELKQAEEYHRKLSFYRRLRAWWSLKGPTVVFGVFVGSLILSFGFWQFSEYLHNAEARAAFGWGVLMAKFFAGTLFPTMFFMLLSMSRWLGTACRRFYHLSRFINWDRHQSFHIVMACLGLFFGTMHAVGHLTGSFVHGSQLPQSKGVAHLLGSKEYAATYWSLLASTPGWTGLAALLVFCIMATCAHPWVRKRNYEVFQASHFLMFPLIALLCAHGTARLLQYPMLGFWLAPPAVLVLLERGHRIYRGFVRIPASIKALDKETVAITCHNRHGKPWRYTAGQYIFLQVPDVSIFEWHPFTVSHCSGDVLQLHIKTDGNWTRQLRSLPSIIEVGIDGPFGAPAQRFYEYDRSLIIGASTGVTPFAAILSDLELKIFEDQDGWSRHRSRGMSFSRSTSRPRSTHHKSHNSSVISLQPRGRSLSVFDSAPSSRAPSQSRSPSLGLGGLGTFMSNDSMTELQATLKVPCSKRVDFHWIVREKNSLLWFSDLLNRTYDLSRTLPPGTLDLNLHTHVTLARTTVSEHIFRYLLDTYRTERNPVSALTGLKSRSHFGRPDFESILRAFHDDIRHEIKQGVTQKGQKIAVFYCGGQALGSILSDLCYDLTMKGRQDGSASRWDFRMEVFG